MGAGKVRRGNRPNDGILIRHFPVSFLMKARDDAANCISFAVQAKGLRLSYP
jgi:hypothetical protein